MKKQTFSITLTVADGKATLDGFTLHNAEPTLADTLSDNDLKNYVLGHDRGAELLECETDSHCGRIITRLFEDVSRVLEGRSEGEDNQLEGDVRFAICTAATDQAMVWLFG